MKVILVRIDDEFIWDDCKKYIDLLDQTRKEKCLRNKIEKNKIVSLIAGLIIRKEAGKGKKVDIMYNQYGKPYLKSKNNLYFSLSHSSNYIVYIQDSKEIGIDIELINKFNYKVSERFFATEETSYIENSLEKNITAYKIWTAKEAYLKKIGTGFAKGGLKINTLEDGIKETIATKQLDDYMLSICASYKIEEKDIEIEEYTAEEILRYFDGGV